MTKDHKWESFHETFTSNSTGSGAIMAKKGRKCLVVFDKTNYVTTADLHNVRQGKIKDPYYPTVLGVGYLGVFKKVPYWKQAKQLWQNMMKRCYSDNDPRGYKSKGVTVDTRWHCFANFLEDIKSLDNFDGWLNSKDIGVEFDLDKDALVKGNKVYSKDLCSFVSRSLNRPLGKRGKVLNGLGEWVKSSELDLR